MAKNKSVKEVSTMVVATNVSQTVNGLKKKSSPLFKVVERFTIKSKADQARLVDTIKKLKAYKLEAEAEMGKFVNPAKAIIVQSKTFFKPFIDSVDEATALGKEKILGFVNQRLLASEVVEEKFKAGKIAKLSTVVSKQDELQSNDNTRNIWVLKISKLGSIPRKYLVPNEPLIREDLKRGKKIVGCKMVQEKTITI